MLTVLAVLGVVVVWVVYRMERWATRSAVLEGLRNELELHRLWVGKPYPKGSKGPWSTDISYLVHRLGTVAIDDAIVRGPTVLFHQPLRVYLVIYRQVLTHLNQLIDQAMAFQANPELWVKNPPPKLLEQHMLSLIEGVHVAGIGATGPGENVAAYARFTEVEGALKVEENFRRLAFAWAITGINFRFLSRWEAFLRPRIGQQWRRLSQLARAQMAKLR